MAWEKLIARLKTQQILNCVYSSSSDLKMLGTMLLELHILGGGKGQVRTLRSTRAHAPPYDHQINLFRVLLFRMLGFGWIFHLDKQLHDHRLMFYFSL